MVSGRSGCSMPCWLLLLCPCSCAARLWLWLRGVGLVGSSLSVSAPPGHTVPESTDDASGRQPALVFSRSDMADFHRARRKPAPRRKHYAQGTGWLSAAGAYRPIGTPDLSLVMDLTNTGVAGGRAARGMGRNGAAGADGATGVDGGRWLPAVRHGTERVVDHNTRAFHQLRREIRRSSRAIPACKAGQELQEVMDNPLLHTQAVTTRIAAGGSRKPAGIGHSHQRSGGAAGQGGGVSTELSQSAGERKRHQAHRHRRQQPQQSEPPREMQRPELPVIVPPFALVSVHPASRWMLIAAQQLTEAPSTPLQSWSPHAGAPLSSACAGGAGRRAIPQASNVVRGKNAPPRQRGRRRTTSTYNGCASG